MTSYQIVILQSDGTTFSESSECLGSDNTIMTNMYCDVLMSTLRAAPYSLEFDDEIYAKVAATNGIGQSEFSDLNASPPTMQTVPEAPTGLARDGTTSETQLVLDWSVLTGDDTGGAAIDSYNVQWSTSGTSTWVDVQGEDGSYDTSNTATASVPSGEEGDYFDFRVRAHNVHGWGSFSSTFSLLAASAPEATTAPTTSVSNEDVVISWAAPADDNSSAVTSYNVYIKNSLGAYVLESEHCSGSTVFAALSCSVPMSKFSGTYGHAAGVTVEAYVTSENIIGESPASPDSSTAASV